MAMLGEHLLACFTRASRFDNCRISGSQSSARVMLCEKLDYSKFQNYWPTLDFCTKD